MFVGNLSLIRRKYFRKNLMCCLSEIRRESVGNLGRNFWPSKSVDNSIFSSSVRHISPLDEELIATTTLPPRSWDERVDTQLRMMGELRDRATHHRLRNALVEHIWRLPENYRQR